MAVAYGACRTQCSLKHSIMNYIRKASTKAIPAVKATDSSTRNLNTVAMFPNPLAESTAGSPPMPMTETTSTVRSWARPDLGADIFIASANQALSPKLPGNGGCRIWNYANTEDAINEAVGLAKGMKKKHDAYNTGFAGAKVVVNAQGKGANEVEIDKKRLMSVIASLLNDMQGTMYTGCDMNTSLEDMDQLSSETRYVLAGIPNLEVNPNDATAFGVLGSLEALAQSRFGGLHGTSFVVHGIGNVGETVARELIDRGAIVYAYDIFPERAAGIPGARVLELPKSNWVKDLPAHDVFVPCSKSGLLDLEAALNLPARAICGSANIPFASSEAEAAYVSFGNCFVPESITSAGAVIADSIEHFDMEAFTEAKPQSINEFCRDAVFDATMQAMKLAEEYNQPITNVIPMLSRAAAAGQPIGSKYRAWAAVHGSTSYSTSP